MLPRPSFSRPSRLATWFDNAAYDPAQTGAPGDRIDWLRCIPFIGMHLACLAVVWVGWSFTAVAAAVALYLLRMFAITGFYHRYFCFLRPTSISFESESVRRPDTSLLSPASLYPSIFLPFTQPSFILSSSPTTCNGQGQMNRKNLMHLWKCWCYCSYGPRSISSSALPSATRTKAREVGFSLRH